MLGLQGEALSFVMATSTLRKSTKPSCAPFTLVSEAETHLWLLALSGDQIKYTASPWKLSCPHAMWRCRCYCLRAGDGTRCLLEFPSGRLLKHWAPLNVSFHPARAHLHGSSWTAKPLWKKLSSWSCQQALFPFCHQDELCMNCYALPLVCCGPIVACVPVRGSLRLSRSH